MLKHLRNSLFHAEDYNPEELARIKDLFAYLMIPLPVTEPTCKTSWDPSTCAGIIRLEENNMAIVEHATIFLPGNSKVLGADSVTRFSVKIGASMGVFSLLTVGFISSDSFKSMPNAYPEGRSVSFSKSGGCNLVYSYGLRFLPECTVTAIHRVKRGDIIFKVTSKEGDDIHECNFHHILSQELFPFFACYCDKSAGQNPTWTAFNTSTGTLNQQNNQGNTQSTPHLLARLI